MSTYPQLIVGVFEHESDAKSALNALNEAGFGKDQIGLALREGGVVTHSLLNDLVKLGVPQDRAGYYDSEYRAGRAIISVRADGREQEAISILRGYRAYDYDTRTASTQTAAAQPGVHEQQYAESERRAIPLHEEQLNVEKQRVQSGEARLHKEVVTEQRSIDVPVTHEEVVIERHAVSGGRVSDTPIGQDEVIRVPVTDEQVNVTKNTVETGEVSIGKRQVQDTQRVTDTVRREEARIEREGDARIRTNEDLTNS
ncbi:MAG: YsnF/AvaK domain-containing protein [Ktedonobacteraceae bacterium]|nr:YsnF/AvaK domain-containing protein [Ktedonobacteraceae bacterium]